jgi:hypothetical protein
MQRQLIEMDTQIISETELKINSGSTCFINHKRINYPQIDELEKEVKALRKKLKENNVSLGKTDTLKILKTRKIEYNRMVREYNDTYNQLAVAWANKLHLGVYTGYSDDEYLNDVITPLNFKLQKMNNTTLILSIIKDIQRKVNEFSDGLQFGTEYQKVYL